MLMEAHYRVRNVRLLHGGDLLADNFTSTAAIASSRWCSLVAPTINAESGALPNSAQSTGFTAAAVIDYRRLAAVGVKP
jgi:hypothetical protein